MASLFTVRVFTSSFSRERVDEGRLIGATSLGLLTAILVVLLKLSLGCVTVCVFVVV
jgi:hypothetical protein